jgi:DNA-binding protein HU-beta
MGCEKAESVIKFENHPQKYQENIRLKAGRILRMNKAEFITIISDKTGLTRKDCEKVYGAMFSAISDVLKSEDKFQIVGFGTFEVRNRAARVGKNPATGEKLEIPAAKYPAFKAGRALKDAVAGA